jgi:tetratricopeptide (TPR) repeat protein
MGMEHEVMAHKSTPTATAPAPQSPPTRSGRPLWQAPLFVLGVGALAAVWFGRPLWPDTPQRRLQRDLKTARHLLSRSDGDPEQARRLAQRALDASDQSPGEAGEAALLLGTAHIRLAERAGAGKARAHWRKAFTLLQQAQRDGVPEGDGVRLTYRLAKAGFHSGDNLQRVIAGLEESADGSDNRAEAYGLLTQAYLRLPQPDLHKALEANRKLRDVAEASESELASAKLLGGELLLRLGKPEEARRSLEKINDQAPPDVLAKARLLQAHSYLDEKKWGDAATLLQAALADVRAVVPEPARVYYDLGVCFRHLDQPQEAGREWQECLKRARGPEGPAAALALAELSLREPEHEKTLQLLARAVAAVTKPAEWSNPLVRLARVQEVFERAADAFRQAGHFDLALRLPESYARVAPPGRAALLRASVAAEWARQRQEKARSAAEEERRTEEDEARKLFRQAGDACAEAAEQPGLGSAEKAELLWQSAGHYQACGEHTLAAGKFEAFLNLDSASARQGEGWYRLAEAQRQGGNAAGAESAYRQAMKYPGRFEFHARYRLALMALQAGDLDEATAALKLNVKQLALWGPDLEIQEKSLFALGGLLYQRRDYREAVPRLEQALKPARPDKAGPEHTLARYQLADCYRQIAAQDNQSFLLNERMSPDTRRHYQSEHRRWLHKAAAEFTDLAEFLAGTKGTDHLSAEQRTQVPFVAAKCWFNLGEYDKALRLYEGLITRHAAKAEGLDALGGAISCHAALGQVDKVRQRLLEIRTALPAMEEAVRKPWEEWVSAAIRELPPSADAAVDGRGPSPVGRGTE